MGHVSGWCGDVVGSWDLDIVDSCSLLLGRDVEGPVGIWWEKGICCCDINGLVVDAEGGE